MTTTTTAGTTANDYNLTEPQLALYRAMQAGTAVTWSSRRDYWLRRDTGERCNHHAHALIKAGLAEIRERTNGIGQKVDVLVLMDTERAKKNGGVI